ncbi:MAG TPA: hypothetical protein VFZ79_08890 [Acidimicrobiales bacterium]
MEETSAPRRRPTPEPAPPPADAEVAIVDYGVDAPGTIPGDAVLAVSNTSRAEPHELREVEVT